MGRFTKFTNAAIQRLKEKGWVQGKGEDYETGAICMMQALYEVSLTEPEYDKYGSMYDGLRTELGMDPIGWNDRVAKKLSDVVNLLRRVAKKLDEKEVANVS